jgi:cytochrome d ubiquinol oxidase subunit I
MLDVLMLSRIQFAANISFHILFPTITIALGWYLFYFKLRHDQTDDAIWMRSYQFWVKIFALTFALGVVSGITMSFQFGTNWPGFMEVAGNISGPLLGYEVMTAFFLEATFLGVMLFGQQRVSSRMHTLATLIVALGTTFSAFWILSLNSWMQYPTGYEIREGVVHATDWMEVIFNPTFPYRLTHMLIASGLTASFLVAGISAYRLLKGDQQESPRKTLKTALTVAALLAPLQAFVGDMHGLNTLEYQPQKIAAMEGVWHTEKGVPLLLFAIPDEEEKTNHFEIGIPNLASLILTHEMDGEIQGLNEFEGAHPPVAPVFYGFRLMVAIGVLMIAAAWIGRWQMRAEQRPDRWVLVGLVALTFAGWVATLAGWYVTEIGRQPWIITGVLSVEQAVTDIAPSHVGISLAMYLGLYAVLLVAYLHTVFLLARKAVDSSNQPSRDPDEAEQTTAPQQPQQELSHV